MNIFVKCTHNCTELVFFQFILLFTSTQLNFISKLLSKGSEYCFSPFGQCVGLLESQQWRSLLGRGHSLPAAGRRESSWRNEGWRNVPPSPLRPASCAPRARVWRCPSPGQKTEDPEGANLQTIRKQRGQFYCFNLFIKKPLCYKSVVPNLGVWTPWRGRPEMINRIVKN